MLKVWQRSNRRAGWATTAAVLGMALLAAPAWAQGQGQPQSRPASRPDDKLPSAQSLLASMVKAMGGEANLRKITHRTLTGTFELPMAQIKAPLVIHGAAPNLRHVSVEIGDAGMFLNGFDGKVAWRDDPQSGAAVIEGPRREQIVQEADFYAALNYRKNFKSVEVAGLVEFNDVRCYQLTLTPRDGVPEMLYINAETNLVAGGELTIIGPEGEVEIRRIVEEYREVDGVQVAVKSRTIIDGFQEQIVTITEVSHEPFDHTIFELPDSIKALLKEKQPPATP